MIAVSRNVSGGVRLIKPAKLYLCMQKHYKYNEDGRHRNTRGKSTIEGENGYAKTRTVAVPRGNWLYSHISREKIYYIYCKKKIRRFYGKIIGNHLPVHFPLFLRGSACRTFLEIKIW